MEDLIDFLKTLPNWAKVLFSFSVLPLYIYRDSIGFIIRKIDTRNILNSNKQHRREIDKLLVHDFFLALRDVAHKVKGTDFSSDNGEINEFKRAMMVELIDLKCAAIDKFFKEFIVNGGIGFMTSQDFKYRLSKGIADLVEEYNLQAIDSFIKSGVTAIDAKYFVHRYEAYRAEMIDSFLARLDSITTSSQYATNYSRTLAMLEVLTVAVEVIPRDVRSLYLQINGRYDKYMVNK